MSFIIKKNELYYVGSIVEDCEGSVEELLYSTNILSAEKFKDLEELDTAVEKHSIAGYAVGVIN